MVWTPIKGHQLANWPNVTREWNGNIVLFSVWANRKFLMDGSMATVCRDFPIGCYRGNSIEMSAIEN